MADIFSITNQEKYSIFSLLWDEMWNCELFIESYYWDIKGLSVQFCSHIHDRISP